MKALQIEFIKLFRPSTYILLGILLLILFIRAEFGFHLVGVDVTGMIKGTDTGMADLIGFIFNIFIIMSIGQEYSENTLRRSIIEGYTRGRFFIGKLLLVIVSAVLLLAVQKLIFLGIAASAGYFKEALDSLTMTGILNALIKIIFNGLFGFFFIFLTRSIAISIVISFVWSSIEVLLHAYLKFKYPESDYGAYLPFASLAQILSTDGAIVFQFLCTAIAYQILMVLGSYTLLSGRDIK